MGHSERHAAPDINGCVDVGILPREAAQGRATEKISLINESKSTSLL